jgi:hypothetical protein
MPRHTRAMTITTTTIAATAQGVEICLSIDSSPDARLTGKPCRPE